MCSLEQFKIDLKGLKNEETSLDFDLDDGFFAALDGAEVKRGSLHVSASIRKATGFYELRLHAAGTVCIPCDRCLDDMEQPIDTDGAFVVKLGDADSSAEDDTIVVDEDEGILDAAWLVYETVALAIPVQHVHAPGKCNPAMTKVLEELSADRSGDVESSQVTDPRWAKLLEVKSEE